MHMIYGVSGCCVYTCVVVSVWWDGCVGSIVVARVVVVVVVVVGD